MSKVILALIVSLAALGVSEYYYERLDVLFWFAVTSSVMCVLSLFVVLVAYTVNYWKVNVCRNCKKNTNI